MTNVFKIRQGKDTYVYRTETAADKKSLLVQFRQVADELAAKKRKEREGEHERRKSMWQGGDVRRAVSYASVPTKTFLREVPLHRLCQNGWLISQGEEVTFLGPTVSTTPKKRLTGMPDGLGSGPMT